VFAEALPTSRKQTAPLLSPLLLPSCGVDRSSGCVLWPLGAQQRPPPFLASSCCNVPSAAQMDCDPPEAYSHPWPASGAPPASLDGSEVCLQLLGRIVCCCKLRTVLFFAEDTDSCNRFLHTSARQAPSALTDVPQHGVVALLAGGSWSPYGLLLCWQQPASPGIPTGQTEQPWRLPYCNWQAAPPQSCSPDSPAQDCLAHSCRCVFVLLMWLIVPHGHGVSWLAGQRHAAVTHAHALVL
jgi:hypothetical protein